MSNRNRIYLILCAAPLATAIGRAAEPKPASLLDVVRRYADTMIERGRDTYGPQKSGLFLSVLDRTTLGPLKSRPAAPGGIRREDRSGEPWNTLVGANPRTRRKSARARRMASTRVAPWTRSPGSVATCATNWPSISRST